MRNSILMLSLILFLLVRSSSVQAADSDESDGGYTSDSETVQWKLLTKINYSHEIRRHPHILLLVTVPWSGESRSLMKQLAWVVANDQTRFGTLKLMLLYKNNERMLANTLGATDETTIIYFHHALPYKYGGRLRVQTILSSMRYIMPLSPEEHPITSLNTPEELKRFLDSTDKAVLLLEFCGWAPRLLAEEKHNMTGHAFGDIAKTNGSLLVEEMRKQKAIKYKQMTCSIGKGVSGLPWLIDSSLANDYLFPEAETLTPESNSLCKIDDLQRLEYFLPKILNFARESFLPPERIRFGLVSERALLRELNIEASSSWLVTLHIAGCPSCSKVLKEDDDLKLALQTQGSVVTELGNEVHDLLPALPANKPSVLLFVDRSSDSLNVRKQSKIALDAFRELALRRQLMNWTNEQNKGQIGEGSLETYQALRSSKHPNLALFPANQNVYNKEKMSLVIMNDGKQISLDNFAPDLQGSSLHEILDYLLRQKKELKLSKVAKDAGFQLLSEDFVIKDSEDSPSQKESQSDQVLELSSYEVSETAHYIDNDQKEQRTSASGPQDKEGSSFSDAESFQKNDEKYVNTSEQCDENCPANTSEQLSHSHVHEILDSAQENNFEGMLTGADQKKDRKDFRGSFFFCDGNFRLLKALTASSKVPSIVIIDPLLQQHFILPEPAVFSHSLLSDLLDEFINGSLTPYENSEIFVQSPRVAPTPPFVNLDFHEVDSVPKVTIHTFTEQVLGNQSNSGNTTDAWSRDVLVLFSNNWCGFCQRMELVVREVYRAIKDYSTMLKNGSVNTSIYNMKNSSFPLVYLMDCTLNDCRRILTSAVEREVYPHLVLFPAGMKNAIPYEGDFAVSPVISFLADSGALAWDEGIPLAGVHQGGKFSKSAPVSQITYHEVLLKERLPANQNHIIRVDSLTNSHETNPKVVWGSILSATDKLLDAHPFSESKILIVKADQDSGFEGLIVNKHLNWNSLEHLEESLELIKDAPLSYGGPVLKRGRPLVALCHYPRKDQDPEILPGIYYLDQLETDKFIQELKLGNKSVGGYWFFLGFSSWGWDQLFHEIAEGAWDVWDGNAEQLDWPAIRE